MISKFEGKLRPGFENTVKLGNLWKFGSKIQDGGRDLLFTMGFTKMVRRRKLSRRQTIDMSHMRENCVRILRRL